MPVTSDSARCRDQHVQISTKSGFDSAAWAKVLGIENLEPGIWNAAEALALLFCGLAIKANSGICCEALEPWAGAYGRGWK